jgi:hypothetical protein
MWGIRILTGPQAGQVIPLSPGQHRLGRGPLCEVKLASNSVSKEHATLVVTEDKIMISDLNSRNGTFVNGVRIQNQRLNIGDKIGLHDILLDILDVPAHATGVAHFPSASTGIRPPQWSSPAAPSWAGNAAQQLDHFDHFQSANAQAAPYGQPHLQMHAQHHEHQATPVRTIQSAEDLMHNLKAYIDNVAMPGIYEVAKRFPYRWSLAGLVGIYVVAVAALSIVPIVSTASKNIQAESIRRAKSIARNMRDSNRRFLMDHNELAVDIRSAELEEGVTLALIVNAKDGSVIAPASKRGESAKRSFVDQARREDREYYEFIDDSTLAVSVPVTFYNSETGNQSANAYAIIFYSTGSLSMSAEQTMSLFFQTLIIALNLDLNDALREGRDDLKTEYDYPVLEALISNVNSALSRIHLGDREVNPAAPANRDIEAANVIRMLRGPALTVSAIDDRVIATNQAFDQLVGGSMNLSGRPLTDIPDMALQKNLIELLPRMRTSVSEIAENHIPFTGESYEVCGQAVMGGSEPAYYLITLAKVEAA